MPKYEYLGKIDKNGEIVNDSPQATISPIGTLSPIKNYSETILDEESGVIINAPKMSTDEEIDFLIRKEHSIEPEDSLGVMALGKDPMSALWRSPSATVISMASKTVSGGARIAGDILKEKQGFAQTRDRIEQEFFGKAVPVTASIEDQIREEHDLLFNSFLAKTDIPDNLLFMSNEMNKNTKQFLERTGLAKTEDDGFIYDFASAGVTIPVSVALSFATGSPVPAAILFGLMQTSSLYNEARDKGIDIDTALMSSILAGSAEAGLEFIGGDILLSAFKSSKPLAKIVLRASNEAMQEMSQQAAEETIAQVSGVREKDITGAIQRTLYAGAIGFAVGVPVHTVTGIVESAGKKRGLSDSQIKKIIEKLQENESDLYAVGKEFTKAATSPLARDKEQEERVKDIIEKFKSGEPIDIPEPRTEAEKKLAAAIKGQTQPETVIEKSAAPKENLEIESAMAEAEEIGEVLSDEEAIRWSGLRNKGLDIEDVADQVISKRPEIIIENYGGFLDGKAENQKSLIRKGLDKQVNFEDAGVMSIRQRIETLHSKDGLEIETFEEPKIKPMSRRQFSRATQQEQDAHEKRMKEAGNKTVYLVNGSDLGKTAYNYASFLLGKENDGGSKGIPKGADLNALPEKSSKAPIEVAQLTRTNRSSLSNLLWDDLGISSDDAVRKPLAEQYRLARAALKEKFGIEVDKQGRALVRHAVDNLVDMYAGLTAMSAVTGMPAKTLGLARVKLDEDGNQTTTGLKIVFRGVNDISALGAYVPSTNEIITPGRSNSLAHEWMHAIDYFILETLGKTQDHLGKKFKGFTGRVRREGVDYLPESIEEAFINLTNTIYFDNSYPALLIMNLEKKLGRAKSEKSKKEIEKQIENIKSGKWQGKDFRSPYYKSAKGIETGKDKGYWTRPTEMTARAFEAWLANKFQQHGIPTDAMTFGHEAYNQGGVFNEMFPHGEDRERIFKAIEALMDTIITADLFGVGNVSAEALPKDKRVDPVFYLSKSADNKYDISLREQLKRDSQEAKTLIQDIILKIKGVEREDGRPKNPNTIWDMSETMYNRIFDSSLDAMNTVIRRNRKRGVSTPKFDRLIKKVGRLSGGLSQEAETFFGVRKNFTRKYENRLAAVLDAAIGGSLNKKETLILRDLYFNRDPRPNDLSPKRIEALKAVAAEIHRINKDMLYEVERGITRYGGKFNIGEVSDDVYLRRVYDKVLVYSKRKEFVQAAFNAYMATYGHPEYISDKFPNFKRLIGTPEETNIRAFVDLAEANGFGKDERISELKETISEDVLEESIAEDDIGAIDPDLYNEVLTSAARSASNAWYMGMFETKSVETTATHSGFSKTRILSPEADVFMEEFLVNDPVEITGSLIANMADFLAWNTQINIEPDAVEKAKMEAIENTMPPEDANFLSELILDSVGKGSGSRKTIAPGMQIFETIRAVSTAFLMKASVFASIAEPFTASLKTGDIRTSWLVYGKMASVVTRDASARDKVRIGQILGLLEHRGASSLMADRTAGTFENNPRLHKFMQRFYENNMLSPLTRIQREGVFISSPIIIGEFLNDATDLSVSDKRRKSAQRWLESLGLKQNLLTDFKAYFSSLEDGMPPITAHQNPSDMDKLYTSMIGNLIDEIIQSPNDVDVPHLANNPVGRWVYGLTRFSFSFWGKVYKAAARTSVQYAKDAAPDGSLTHKIGIGSSYFMRKFFPAFLQYYLATSLVFMTRTILLNYPRWEDMDDEERFKTVALGGLAYTTPLGVLGDFIINAVSGIKYNRQITEGLTPPAAGVPLKVVQAIVNYFGRNSKNNNTAERALTESLYDLFIVMPTTVATGLLPGIPGKIAGMANIAIGSKTAKEPVITAIAGPKEKKETNKY